MKFRKCLYWLIVVLIYPISCSYNYNTKDFSKNNTLKTIKNNNNPILNGGINKHIAGNCIIKDQQGDTLLFYYQNNKTLSKNFFFS